MQLWFLPFLDQYYQRPHYEFCFFIFLVFVFCSSAYFLKRSSGRLGRRSGLDGRSGSWSGDRDSGNWDSDGCGSLKLSSGRLGRRSRGRLDGRSGSWGGDRHDGNWDGNGGSSLKKSVIGLGGDGEEGSNKDREGLHCIYILDVIEIWCK